jgi:hypothetical protein
MGTYMIYHTNELAIELPEGLRDKSLNIFTLTDEGPSEFSFVISRVPLHAGKSLADCVSSLVDEMKEKMPSFALLNRSDDKKVAGEPATHLEFVWKAQNGVMHQRQVAFAAPGGGMVVILTGTCQDKFTPQWAQAYEVAVNSVRLEKL